MVEQVYRGRKPKASPLWQCLSHHFDEFLEAYKERFQPRYGFLRPIIPEVVEKFLECGDLESWTFFWWQDGQNQRPLQEKANRRSSLQ